MAKVAFVGLGVMGYPMAGHLKTKGGHDVTVFNRTAAKAEKWVAQYGGKSAPTPKDAAQDQDFVMACVGNDNDLREVMLGKDGIFAGVRKGAIVVDHTTASAEIARELHAEAKTRGFDFIDAPVSGGQAGAENGVLTVMCGGDAGPFAQAEKVIARLRAHLQSHGRFRFGPARQDGEPNLHRRRRAGARRGAVFCAEGGTRHRKARRRHLQGRRAVLADGEPLQDHGRGQIRFRLCGRLDAQGSRHLSGRSAAERRAPAAHRFGRSVLLAGAENGRAALGYVEPNRAVATLTLRLRRKMVADCRTESVLNRGIPLGTPVNVRPQFGPDAREYFRRKHATQGPAPVLSSATSSRRPHGLGPPDQRRVAR